MITIYDVSTIAETEFGFSIIMKHIADLKKGEHFTFINSSRVWVRGEYNRSLKKFSCYRLDDVRLERFYDGSKLVLTDFEF